MPKEKSKNLLTTPKRNQQNCKWCIQVWKWRRKKVAKVVEDAKNGVNEIVEEVPKIIKHVEKAANNILNDAEEALQIVKESANKFADDVIDMITTKTVNAVDEFIEKVPIVVEIVIEILTEIVETVEEVKDSAEPLPVPVKWSGILYLTISYHGKLSLAPIKCIFN